MRELDPTGAGFRRATGPGRATAIPQVIEDVRSGLAATPAR